MADNDFCGPIYEMEAKLIDTSVKTYSNFRASAIQH